MISRNLLGFRHTKIWSVLVSGKLFTLLYGVIIFFLQKICNTQNQVRWSSFRSSEPFTDNIENHPKVLVEKNPPEWKYVESLLGCRVIPVPLEKSEFPSNWKPQDVLQAQQSPYFIERTKNYMCPVYLNKTFRGQRQITKIRRIEGKLRKVL